MSETETLSIAGHIDLAARTFGGRALQASDEFFAPKENLLEPQPPRFVPGEFTERGKWMDGWESRRKRGPGHDHCVVKLGARGVIRAVDIDTNHFLGNHPPFASMDAAHAPDGVLEDLDWIEILPQSPLRPGSQNLFTVRDPNPFTHVRLHIYPDGGVARLRVWGEVEATWEAPTLDEETARHVRQGERDLAAVVNGGKALACSDAFFGPMDNLLLPGRAAHMGGGWETRRKRPAPGNDWIVVRLGDAGTVSVLEIDTNHFKGNYPDRVALRGLHVPGAPLTELVDPSTEWVTVLPETKLEAHARRFFTSEIQARGPYTHIRLDVYPDGGVSRLRVWGHREAP